MRARVLGGLSAVSWLIVAAACATSPSGPPPTLTCPAPIQMVSPDNNPVVVTFTAPATAGTPSVTSTCAPASGSLFAVGTTAVRCSAPVSGPPVSCSFNVTVSPPPRLEKTRTLAFGDSITFGSNAICVGGSATALRWTPAELLRPWADLPPSPSTSYPSVLQASLRARYTAQNPVVVNAGSPGEAVNDGETRRRFTSALAANQPEILLLQEGINDLHGLDFYGIPYAQGIAGVVGALRDMSLEARARGIHVFLGTLLPERPNGCRAFAIPPKGKEDLITPTNNQIRSMAAAQNIDLIDLAMVFSGQDSYIGQDGLHPSDAGYSAMAKAFFDAIRAKFERPAASSARR